jgi:DNA-binding transcriptional LysR family regulator
MVRNIDTALLRTFTAVAGTSGMTSAGHLLNLTQAAVSQQIKRLEDTFGRQLFERSRRGLRLTSSGERLLGKAKRAVALNDEIWAEMIASAHTGNVRLGMPEDLVSAYLPSILSGFSTAHPQVQISIVCNSSAQLLSALGTGEVDLALTTELACGADGESLASERLVWVGAIGGEAHLRRPIPLSIGTAACAFRPCVMRALDNAQIEWRPVSEIANMEAMYTPVRIDIAITAMLASTIPSGVEVLGTGSGLPPLPLLSITLYLPKIGTLRNAFGLARHVRNSFVGRQSRAA